jgi:hypothetical protein
MPTIPNRSTVHLVAEVQWQIDGHRAPGPQVPGDPGESVNNQDDHTSFVYGFQSRVHAQGFQRLEYLQPYGSRMMAYRPTSRIGSNSRPGLYYEIGPGFFAAHATEPLRDPEEFSTMVREGMKAVLAARDWRSKDQPFSYITVRVLDAFREPWVHEQDLDDFLKHALGIDVRLPPGIARHVRPGYRYKPMLRLQIYTVDNRELTISADLGELDYQLAYLLDATVATEDRDIQGLDAAVLAVDQSYAIIRDMFADIPAPPPR